MSNTNSAENDKIDELDKINKEIDDVNISTQNLMTNNDIKSAETQHSLQELKRIEKMLQDKRNILITRNRMLQLSQDRNIHKQRIVYTMLALIIACMTLVLVGYTAFSK